MVGRAPGFTLLEMQVVLVLAAGLVLSCLALGATALEARTEIRGLQAVEDRSRLIHGVLDHTIRHPDPLTLDLRPDPTHADVMTVYQEGQPAVPGIQVVGISVLRRDPDQPDERIWIARDPGELAGQGDLAEALIGVYAVRFDFRVRAGDHARELTRILPRAPH